VRRFTSKKGRTFNRGGNQDVLLGIAKRGAESTGGAVGVDILLLEASLMSEGELSWGKRGGRKSESSGKGKTTCEAFQRGRKYMEQKEVRTLEKDPCKV